MQLHGVLIVDAMEISERGCEEAGKAKEVGSQLNQKIPRGAAPVDLIGSPLTRCDGSEWANHRIQIW